MATGKIVQIQGPVVDVAFEPRHLPEILNAVRIPKLGTDNGANGNGNAYTTGSGTDITNINDVIVEVAQHLGNDVVRCVAMSSTDGLIRGQEAIDTGSAITVPVGPETLGRVFNLLGRPIDERGPANAQLSYPDPPPRPGVRGSGHQGRGAGNGHQGH
jgi:F-type H+-transporting ATPase subunit beta